MGDGRTPGNGSTSPLGDGAGGATKGIGAMADFTRTPGGNPTGGSTPRDLTRPPAVQQKPAGQRTNTADAAPGGPIPAAAPPPVRPGGVGTPGNSAKPFRLGGG